MMKWDGRRILLIFSFYLISGSWLMSGAWSESESGQLPTHPLVFPSQRPIINYRTKIQGIRYGEAVPAPPSPPSSFIPRLTVKSYEEPKTEIHAPIYDDEYDEEVSVPEFTTNNPIILASSATTHRIPSIPNALKRNFAFLTAATTTATPYPSSSSSQDELRSKSNNKTKSTRRRKVKRPTKSKSTTSKTTEEDLGNAESAKESSGDKSLALEIGSQDGKYALINHFFGNTTDGNNGKRPGIVSYAQSDDFIDDNEKTLGKLEENDIWLSEGHLLVLKGGDFDSASRDKWQPIDAYERDKTKPPLRIALDTDNPPPFPVFVNRTGPPIFLGPPPPFPIPGYGEFNESFDPSRLPPPGLIPLFPNGSVPEFFGPPGGFPPHGFPPPGNHSFPPFRPGGLTGPPGGLYGNGGPPGGVYGNGGGGYGEPPRQHNGTLTPPPFFPFPPPPGSKNGSFPPPPFFPFGPPGNGPPPGFNPGGPFFPPLVLNPKDNETDDPSIFLPPPYDFDYYEDNTTIVPPGPFAPGLVVPPPKDFYVVYNKTSPPPVYIPSTTTPNSGQITDNILNLKPQRPNAKRPKFPITTPKDDTLEENPPQTTPTLLVTPFPKKRKQGRGKSGKSYSSKESSEEVNGGEGESPQHQTVTQRPEIVFHARQASPTPRPPNYIYVRGKLKTLAEIAAEAVAAEGGSEKKRPTPAPAFDELGYPNRDADLGNNGPPEHEFPKKKKNPRKQTPKVYFTGQQGHRQVSPPVRQVHQEITPVFPSANPNIQITPSVYTLNNQHYQYPSQNNQGQTLFYQTNPFLQQNPNPESIGPTYFTPEAGGRDANQNDQSDPNTQQQLYQSVQPYYSTPAHQHHHQLSPTFPSQTSPTSPTYPQSYHPDILQSTFNPPTERKRPRSRVIFPDEQERRPRLQDPQIYNNPLIYQGQNPQGHGYYSPVTQYRTLSGQFIPNTYYQNPGSGGHPGTFSTQFLHPQVQQQASPFYQQLQQQQQYQQQPQNTYYDVQQLPQDRGQAVPLHSDILVNYREPLPQYNTESESVTTRSVLKAGPSPAGGTFGNQPTGEGAIVPAPQGSFYSFERGGPGGFSYKIRL